MDLNLIIKNFFIKYQKLFNKNLLNLKDRMKFFFYYFLLVKLNSQEIHQLKERDRNKEMMMMIIDF